MRSEDWVQTSAQTRLPTKEFISNTVKPFNFAALKVDDFACKFNLAPFI